MTTDHPSVDEAVRKNRISIAPPKGGRHEPRSRHSPLREGLESLPYTHGTPALCGAFDFAGIRLGLGVSIILVVAAEMVVGKVGLGARLYLAGQVLETEQVFAVLIVLAVLGIVITKLQVAVDRRLNFWRTS